MAKTQAATMPKSALCVRMIMIPRSSHQICLQSAATAMPGGNSECGACRAGRESAIVSFQQRPSTAHGRCNFCRKKLDDARHVAERHAANIDLREKALMTEQLAFIHDLVNDLLRT